MSEDTYNARSNRAAELRGKIFDLKADLERLAEVEKTSKTRGEWGRADAVNCLIKATELAIHKYREQLQDILCP